MRIKLSDTARLILAAIAMVLILLLVGWVVLAFVPHQYTDRIQGKWVRFGVVSIFLIGYATKAYWKLRRSMGLWAIFAGFLIIHAFGVGRFFYLGNGLPLLTFGPVCGIEFGCMALTIYWFLGAGPDKVNLNV
jgi:hypothetical protein